MNHKSHVPFWWIFGSLGVGLGLIIILILIFISLRSSRCFNGGQSHAKNSDEKISHKFHILRNTSFCCGSGRYICCKSAELKQPVGEASERQMNIPRGLTLIPTLISFAIY